MNLKINILLSIIFIFPLLIFLRLYFIVEEEFEVYNNIPTTDKIIEVKGFRFVPETLGVKVGESVTFINNEDMYHDVTLKPFQKGIPLPPKSKITIKFQTIENVSYYCSPHLAMGMKGTIVVQKEDK